MNKIENYLGIANHDIQMANNSQELKSYVASILCNGCNGQFLEDDMYLVFVLGDCYCERCFKEWLERAKKYKQEDVDEDLRYQKEHSFQWYKYHLPYLEKEED